MDQHELEAAFDRQASGYERQQQRMAPVHDGLYFQLQWIWSGLPRSERILCVGLGVGAELSYLAGRFPGWSFTAVEPSGAMLSACRRRAESEGFASRCVFHEGYLESLPDVESHDAATCLLVSPFLLDATERSRFFQTIAMRLRPGGILVSADLASDVGSIEYAALLTNWVTMLHAADVPPDATGKTHAAWKKDVAILPPGDVKAIVARGGFDTPVQFYQAGLVHAWFARRSVQNAG